jgi:tRNA-specific 2-thiouridylase
VRLDPAQKQVVVGPREALSVHHIHIDDVHWLGDKPIGTMVHDGIPVFVRVRSTRPPKAAMLFATPAGVEVELEECEEGVAPGQACVFYDSTDDRARVLGGGIIKTGSLAGRRAPAQRATNLAEAATRH